MTRHWSAYQRHIASLMSKPPRVRRDRAEGLCRKLLPGIERTGEPPHIMQSKGGRYFTL